MDADFPEVQELTTEEAKDCIRQFCDAGIHQINFSGGEPLLREDFFNMLKFASDQGLKVGFTTNGSLLTEDKVKMLKTITNLDFVQVSLDGKDSQVHDYIRGVDESFNKAITAIKLLVRNGIKTGVVSTVMKQNVSQIPGIVQLLKSLGVSTYGARRFMPVGRGESLKQKILISPQEYKEHLQYWIQCMHEKPKHIDFIIEEPLLGLLKDDLPEDWLPRGCLAGSHYGAITSTGDIRGCIFIPVAFGNIRERSFKNIWENSLERKKIVLRELNGMCGECVHIQECGGCRAMAYADSGDFLGDDPFCFVES